MNRIVISTIFVFWCLNLDLIISGPIIKNDRKKEEIEMVEKRKEPVERAPIDDDGLWWKSRVIIACTVIASLEIVIVIVMIIYWRQIRFYFTKIHCPCDDYLYERRMRRELNRVVPPSDITMDDRQSRNISRPISTVQLQPRELLNNPSSEQHNNASEESNRQSVSAQVHREADLEETEQPSVTHSTNVESCNEQDTFRDLSVSDISDEEYEKTPSDGFLSKKGYENASFEEEPSSSSSLSTTKKNLGTNKTKEPECLHRLLTE